MNSPPLLLSPTTVIQGPTKEQVARAVQSVADAEAHKSVAKESEDVDDKQPFRVRKAIIEADIRENTAGALAFLEIEYYQSLKTHIGLLRPSARRVLPFIALLIMGMVVERLGPTLSTGWFSLLVVAATLIFGNFAWDFVFTARRSRKLIAGRIQYVTFDRIVALEAQLTDFRISAASLSSFHRELGRRCQRISKLVGRLPSAFGVENHPAAREANKRNLAGIELWQGQMLADMTDFQTRNDLITQIHHAASRLALGDWAHMMNRSEPLIYAPGLSRKKRAVWITFGALVVTGSLGLVGAAFAAQWWWLLGAGFVGTVLGLTALRRGGIGPETMTEYLTLLKELTSTTRVVG